MKLLVNMFLLLVATLTSFGRMEAQANWFQPSSPSARWGMGMVFEVPYTSPLRFGTLLFGGIEQLPPGNVYNDLGDTWIMREGGWFQLNPITSPPARDGAGMAFDWATGTVVLFGGQYGIVPLNDTWIWNGTNWTQVSPPVAPSARAYGAMVYDPATRKVVLFGGVSGLNGPLGDTWNWDGTTRTWTQLFPANSPGARQLAAIAYHEPTGRVVLFGGQQNTGDYSLGDTWVWSGTNWQQRTVLSAPGARLGASMAYDPSLQSVVLFGGCMRMPGGDCNFYTDTWRWNGSSWIQVVTAAVPDFRASFGMTYDPVAQGLVIFGGTTGEHTRGDTWILGMTQ
jgi:Galactose oxidase, central domain